MGSFGTVPGIVAAMETLSSGWGGCGSADTGDGAAMAVPRAGELIFPESSQRDERLVGSLGCSAWYEFSGESLLATNGVKRAALNEDFEIESLMFAASVGECFAIAGVASSACGPKR